MRKYVFWTNGMLYMALHLKRQAEPDAPYVAITQTEWQNYYRAVQRSLENERDLQYDFDFMIKKGEPDDLGSDIANPKKRRELTRANFHYDPKRKIYWTQSGETNLFDKARLCTPSAVVNHLLPKGYERALNLPQGPISEK